MAKQPVVKNMFSPREAVISPKGKQKAQQQFKADADINTIMKKFQKGEAIDHYAKHKLVYGEATPTDYHTSMNIVRNAETMFMELPSNVRNRFENDPAAFLEFVQNPENVSEAQALGLGLAPAAQATVDTAIAADVATQEKQADIPQEPPADPPQ